MGSGAGESGIAALGGWLARGWALRIAEVVPRSWRAGWVAVVTAVALGLALWCHAVLHNFHRITDFIEIGRKFAGPMGVSALATSPVGYDGQYYYFIARFPGQHPNGAFAAPALFYSRIAYPVLVRVFSLGQAGAMPWAMLGINLAAVIATVLVFAALLRARGLPQWLALVPGLYCGQALAVLRDLTDPLMMLWLVVALWGLSQRRWLAVGAALGLGMMTREAMIPFVFCFAVPLVIERRWRMLGAYGALALVPYAICQVCVHALLGVWGLGQTAHEDMFLPLPFAGLAASPTAGQAISMLLLTCIPAVCAIGYGLCALRGRPWGDALLLGAALAAIVYGALFLMRPGVLWVDLWQPPRQAAPFALLVPLLIPRGARRPGWYAVPWLMMSSLAFAFTV